MAPTNELNELAGAAFRLGEWLVEPRLNRVSRRHESIQIELKMMDVLVCLAGRAGELVTRQELIDTVWSVEYITEKTLTRAVAELRRTLGDDAKEPTYIETIHRKGYRLIAPVERVTKPSAKVTPFPVPPGSQDDRDPYPGLAPFTEADAELFFGREAEVAQLWRMITTRRLLAVIGPSGVGKTSFLRAGLIPAAPEGWGVLICQPGEAPFAALARALAPEFEGDAGMISKLVGIHEPSAAVAVVSRWRGRCDQALLIVDQFEELFTQNAAEEQRRFAELLGRLAADADVHVLMSMRDDFLYRCHEHTTLRPVFSELTPIEVPSRDDLRRGLVQPAARYGYSFEDDALPDEMLDAVAGERGALPLLAFAVARLWDKRDRERRSLTRQAYADIGGVGGALAHHAEMTLEKIGAPSLPIVRELFRNMVTAEGTRAVREWDELLSIFSESAALSSRATTGPKGRRESRDPPTSPENVRRTDSRSDFGGSFDSLGRSAPSLAQDDRRGAAEDVLGQLIDARLLTSYEIHEEDRAPTRRVEIIHESLLGNWPRLVRWQTQDTDSIHLRDELRQAARIWREHGQTDDLLWTGSAYREYALWRERYPGGLTEIEESFATAMTSLATRRRRRRRTAAAAALVLVTIIAGIFGTLWRSSVRETRRAEAAKLLALAEVQIDNGPTEALAYATASLELADTREGRLFALRALWEGPPLRALDLGQFNNNQYMVPTFSPDGRWLALAGLISEYVLVYGEKGGEPIALGGHHVSAAGAIQCSWSRDGLLVTGHNSEGRVRVWAMPEGRLVRTINFSDPARWQVGVNRLFAEVGPTPKAGEPWPLKLLSWELPDGEREDLGTVDFTAAGANQSMFDPSGGSWIFSKGDGVYARRLPITPGIPDTLLARHSSEGVELEEWRRGEGFYSRDSNGEIFLWSSADGKASSVRRIHRTDFPKTHFLSPDPTGHWIAERPDSNVLKIWNTEGLIGARAMRFERANTWHGTSTHDFEPRGSWVAVTTDGLWEVTFWPLSWPRPFVVDGWILMNISPDGRYLLTSSWESVVKEWTLSIRLWPLPGFRSGEIRDLSCPPSRWTGNGLVMSPNGEQVLVLGYGGMVALVSVDGCAARHLDGFPNNDLVRAGGFSPSGRFVAAASATSDEQATLRVWDLQNGNVKVFDEPAVADAYEGYFANNLAFVNETHLLTAGANGLLSWNLETGSVETLRSAPRGGIVGMSVAPDAERALVYEAGPSWDRQGEVYLHDLTTGQSRNLVLPGKGWLTLSVDGTIWASGETDGSVWVGLIDGGQPHLLLGHQGVVRTLISPDHRWIATSGQDQTLRLWPMPDLSKPPLHTLPRAELIAKLKTLTNLRAVRDEASSTGWKIEVGPFPGWETVPTW